MTATSEIKAGDKVTSRGRLYRVVAVVSVYGIPAADLVPVRKDGSDGVGRRFGRGYKNLPLTCLEKADEGRPPQS
jgi:antitoxin (DNA-binding transcriptional repressor) of toxin-antitoxin stability system